MSNFYALQYNGKYYAHLCYTKIFIKYHITQKNSKNLSYYLYY
jgi:hypothetical protein